MSVLRRVLLRLYNAIRPAPSNEQLDREVASHLALLEDRYRARGLTPDEARVAARLYHPGIVPIHASGTAEGVLYFAMEMVEGETVAEALARSPLPPKQAAVIAAQRAIPEFGPGDTLKVNVKVTEGTRTRVQAYEGVCISRSGGGLNERIIQLIALLTVLSLAPSILVMMTSFTRIVVVLSLLRTALGTATAPPNSVGISLAYIMNPAATPASWRIRVTSRSLRAPVHSLMRSVSSSRAARRPAIVA